MQSIDSNYYYDVTATFVKRPQNKLLWFLWYKLRDPRIKSHVRIYRLAHFYLLLFSPECTCSARRWFLRYSHSQTVRHA